MSCWPGTPDRVITVAAHDGVELTVEEFAPHSASRTVLVFLHGIGSYAGPYRRFAREVADAGVFVYLPDLRGHGRSGIRGHMGTPATVMGDIQALIDHARTAHPGCEVVLGGESMGGLFATAYAASGGTATDRLLLVAPALQPRWGKWLKAALARRPRRRLATDPRGGIALHSPMTGVPVRNPEFRSLCADDPLMLQRGSIGYLATVVWLNVGWAFRYPARIKQPVLVVHGDADAVVALAGATTLADRLPDADLRVVGEAWHNLFWDPTRDATVGQIAEWLSGRRG